MLAGAQSWTFSVSPQGQAVSAPASDTSSAEQAPVSSVAALILSLAQTLEFEAGWTVHIVTALRLNGLVAQTGIPAVLATMAVEQLIAAGLLTPYRGCYLLCDVEALRRIVLDRQA